MNIAYLEHAPFAAFLAVLIGIHLRKAWLWREHLVLTQDYNPVHFGRLFLGAAMPPQDDSEYGESPGRYSFSSLIMVLAPLLTRCGAPLHTLVAMHIAAAYPMLCLGLYGLTLAITGSAYAALLGVLLFAFRDFSLFEINRNYPVLINKKYYYTDMFYAFCAFALWATAQGATGAAAAWTGLTVLCNPLLGANLALIVCGSWFIALFAGAAPQMFILPAAGIAACVAVAYINIRMATRDFKPCADQQAREACIRVYPEISPHSMAPENYAVAMGVLLAFLVGGLILSLSRAGAPQPGGLALPISALLVFILWTNVAYWLLYTRAIFVFLKTCPGKSLIPLTLLAVPTVAEAAANLLASMPLCILLAMAVWQWHLKPVAGDEWLRRYWLALACAVLLWCLLAPGSSIIAPYTEIGRILAPALLAWSALGESLAFLRNGSLHRARAQLDIAQKIRDALPGDACFLPYRLTENAPNLLVSDFAFRTFSQRGMLHYWYLFRIAYFDSAQRYLRTALSCSYMGLDIWSTLKTRMETLRKEQPLHFYTGIERLWPPKFSRFTPLGKTRVDIVMQQRHFSYQPLPMFMRFARKMQATHLLVSLPPDGMPNTDRINYADRNGNIIASYPIILSNASFAVIAVS
ncbi:MAG TPA: hypothetical protein VE028_03125 [Nitratidesulfovibrio sp.]|nr:hypothetical protein [Nitratidesulfovibrio sp.]